MHRRAQRVIDLAKRWLLQPPKAGNVHEYSYKGKLVAESEVAHLEGVGRYVSDAWRIFCKIDLYRRAGFKVDVPEWTKVHSTDKELRAYLQWKRTAAKKRALKEDCHEADALSTHLENLSLGESVKTVTRSGQMVGIIFKGDGSHISVPAKMLLSAAKLG